MQAVTDPRLADVQDELDYWRQQHRRGQLGYHPFEGVPEGTVRAVCEAYNAHPQLSEQDAIREVRQSLCLTPGSMHAHLADWLAPRCLRHLRSP
ncbi:hypothetical protein HG421_15715 [Xanthomonas campestris pv. badrii]|uniref:Uncharacterized protein n=1 Tax=Xanthomonas campestris pv. badrii TaxID=149696 RepID=A0A7Z2VCR6_XANCA|nr:hypothetical protein [Xanthomonas campestris]MCC4603998.1 hypothetical protein [Xanthomonas campestris pv. parthenii]QJD69008.1 hypothetical protein HG421_15715 [Xanthomonas campestris pv. badrii]